LAAVQQTHVPRLLALPTRIVALASGGMHTLALDANGDVYAWGANSLGQCGRTASEAPALPVKVALGRKATAIAVGYEHSLALAEGGTVFAWGNNHAGQLGLGHGMNQEAPELVAGDVGRAPIGAIAAGYASSAFVTNDGGVLLCGLNHKGQLGLGHNESPVPHPQRVDGLAPVEAIALGQGHAIAALRQGGFVGWGLNAYGELGLPAATVARPEPLSWAVAAAELFVGWQHTLALERTGRCLAAGRGDYGQIGQKKAYSKAALPVQGATFVALGPTKQLSARRGDEAAEEATVTLPTPANVQVSLKAKGAVAEGRPQ